MENTTQMDGQGWNAAFRMAGYQQVQGTTGCTRHIYNYIHIYYKRPLAVIPGEQVFVCKDWLILIQPLRYHHSEMFPCVITAARKHLDHIAKVVHGLTSNLRQPFIIQAILYGTVPQLQ